MLWLTAIKIRLATPWGRQRACLEALAFNPPKQVSRKHTRYKDTARTGVPQSGGKRQTAHDMARSDINGRVDPKSDVQAAHSGFVAKEYLTGMPAAASAALAPAGVCSVKWKMLAAATADAPARTASTMCW
jgi:hypothetical protein